MLLVKLPENIRYLTQLRFIKLFDGMHENMV